MNDPTWQAVCVTLIGVISSSIPAILAYLKSRDSLMASQQNAETLKTIKVDINGRITSLIQSEIAKAYAEGHVAGLQQGAQDEAARLSAAAAARMATTGPVTTSIKTPEITISVPPEAKHEPTQPEL